MDRKAGGWLLIAISITLALGVCALYARDFARREHDAVKLTGTVAKKLTYTETRGRGNYEYTVHALKVRWTSETGQHQRRYEVGEGFYRRTRVGDELRLFLKDPRDMNSARLSAPWPAWTGLAFMLGAFALLGTSIGAFLVTWTGEPERPRLVDKSLLR